MAALVSTPGVGIAADGEETPSYAERTPGYDYHVRGSHAYHDERYDKALEQFRAAARWADKPSQYNIGVMYYLGLGVERDRPRALAWVRLAGERGYPQVEEMAEQMREELNESQARRAERILEEELLPEFGDEVTVPRTRRRMVRERRNVTGSRVGSLGPVRVIDRDGRTYDGETFYDDDLWDFDRVMDYENDLFDAMHRGRVELGEFRVKEPEDDR